MADDDQQIAREYEIQLACDCEQYIAKYPNSSLSQVLRQFVAEIQKKHEEEEAEEAEEIVERASRGKRWQYTP